MNTARALTLLETIVTVSLFTVIMTSIIGSILLFYESNTSSIEQGFQVESARKGVEVMVREMREMTYGDDGTYPILSMASTSITFFSDTDRDDAIEQITYTLNSTTTLLRTVIEPSGTPIEYTGGGSTTPLSTYVRNLEESSSIFRYYDENGLEILDYNQVDEVKFVTVSLIVNILPVRAPQEFTLRSSATLRNLRDL